MERWSDQGIVLGARAHGEGAAVASVLTRDNGRHAGFVHGGRTSQRLKAWLQPGGLVEVEWSARTAEQLGRFEINDGRAPSPLLVQDPERLLAMLSACALIDICIAERTPHAGVYHGTVALFEALAGPAWAAAYVLWEIALLREAGFGIDMSRCAVTGTTENLTHVSPKTGRAVCAQAAQPYLDRLFALPDFLKGGSDMGDAEIAKGLAMTGYFIEHRIMEHTTSRMPEVRERLATYFTGSPAQTG